MSKVAVDHFRKSKQIPNLKTNHEMFQPGSLKTISDNKLITFAVGKQTKSRFVRAKEDAETRKRENEKDAAKIYDTFVKSFEDPGDSKIFVRGSTENSYEDNYSSKRSRLHDDSVNARLTHVSATDSNFGNKKVRELDKMLGELKSRHERSEAPVSEDCVFDGKGSFDNGDPNTTNIFVSHLATTVTGSIPLAVYEEQLFDLFRKFGEINSVKIMWPRNDDERLRKRNCGFVSFMRRSDAETALNELQDQDIDGLRIILYWGKPVQINSTAMTMPSLGHSTSVVLEPASSRRRSSSLDEGSAAPTRITVEVPASETQCSVIDLLAKFVAANGQEFEKAVFVRELQNPLFDFLRRPDSKEAEYYRWRTFAFAMNDDDETWREDPWELFRQGPLVIPPRSSRRIMSQPGSVTRDRSATDREKYAGMTGAQIERLKARANKSDPSTHFSSELSGLVHGGSERLGNEDFDFFDDCLRHLSVSRERIKNAMAFAFDSVESSEEVIFMIKESLVSSASPPHRIACLYLISDILFNSGSSLKSASNYRILVQQCLPEIFHHVGEMYRGVTGRMTAKQVEDRVRSVLVVWREWSMFSPLFTLGLEASVFAGEIELKRLQQEIEDSTAEVVDDREFMVKKASSAGIYVRESSSARELIHRLRFVESFAKNQLTSTAPSHEPVLAPEVVDDVDGEPLGDDLDGVPLDEHEVEDSIDEDIDGAPVDDLDGEPCDEDL